MNNIEQIECPLCTSTDTTPHPHYADEMVCESCCHIFALEPDLIEPYIDLGPPLGIADFWREGD